MSRFGREIPTSVGMTKVRRDEGAYRPWPACNSMPKGIDNAPVATSPRRAAAAAITPSRSSRRLGSDTEVAICSLDSAGLNWLRKPSFDTDRTATSAGFTPASSAARSIARPSSRRRKPPRRRRASRIGA